MAFSKLFIDRPILAGVISVLVMLVGAVAYLRLPVSQYPEVAPPTITVTTSYPGANAETVAAAGATTGAGERKTRDIAASLPQHPDAYRQD